MRWSKLSDKIYENLNTLNVSESINIYVLNQTFLCAFTCKDTTFWFLLWHAGIQNAFFSSYKSKKTLSNIFVTSVSLKSHHGRFQLHNSNFLYLKTFQTIKLLNKLDQSFPGTHVCLLRSLIHWITYHFWPKKN